MTSQSSAIDSHVHVFVPEKYAYSEERSYTPGNADVPALALHLERLGIEKVVLVQPSPYGIDNRATLSAVAELGLARARAIAVIDPFSATAADVQELAARGVAGVRANLKTNGVDDADACASYLRGLEQALSGTDMIIEVFLSLPLLLRLRKVLVELGRPVVLDHFAGLKTTSPSLSDDVEGLVDLLGSSNLVLKVSGACRATDYASSTAALDLIAPRLIDAAPGRVIWGSDWPHTGRSSERKNRQVTEIEPFMPVDDQASLADLARWAGDPRRLDDILRTTPAALFSL